MKTRYAGFFLLAAIANSTALAADARVYDIHPPVRGQQHAGTAAAQAKIDAFQRQLGPNATVNVQWDVVSNQLGSVTFSPPLPQPPNTDAVQRARTFLESNPELFGLSAQAIGAMVPEILVREPERDVVGFHQAFNGIPFFDQQGLLRVVLTPAGVAAASGSCAIGAPLEPTPKLSVSDAYVQMRRQLPNLWKTSDGKPSPHDGQSGAPAFEADPRIAAGSPEDTAARQSTLITHAGMDFTGALSARLTYFLDGAQARLAWEFNMNGTRDRFNEPGTNGSMIDALEVLIDAQDGRVLLAHVETGDMHGIASAAPAEETK
jgi:hypothetical protein